MDFFISALGHLSFPPEAVRLFPRGNSSKECEFLHLRGNFIDFPLNKLANIISTMPVPWGFCRYFLRKLYKDLSLKQISLNHLETVSAPQRGFCRSFLKHFIRYHVLRLLNYHPIPSSTICTCIANQIL